MFNLIPKIKYSAEELAAMNAEKEAACAKWAETEKEALKGYVRPSEKELEAQNQSIIEAPEWCWH